MSQKIQAFGKSQPMLELESKDLVHSLAVFPRGGATGARITGRESCGSWLILHLGNCEFARESFEVSIFNWPTLCLAFLSFQFTTLAIHALCHFSFSEEISDVTHHFFMYNDMTCSLDVIGKLHDLVCEMIHVSLRFYIYRSRALTTSQCVQIEWNHESKYLKQIGWLLSQFPEI